ncbi:MAG: PAS domain-containing protein [bacterium]
MDKTPKIFKELEKIAPLIPVPLYWLDIDGVFMGMNDLCLKATGVMTSGVFIGKKYDQAHPKDIAEAIIKNLKLVVSTGKTVESEEVIRDFSTGRDRCFTAIRSPLHDEDGAIVGIIATSIEITDKKNAERLQIENELHRAQIKDQLKFKKIVDQAAHDIQSPLAILLVLAQQCTGFTKEKIFDMLKTFTAFIPVGIYWSDTNNRVVGANKNIVAAVGGKSVDDFLGKTPYEYYPKEMADNIVKHNNEVMRTGKILSQEEQIRDVTTGKIKYFISYKAPLFDNNEKIIGILGASADITTEKEAEYTKEELRKTQIEVEAQKKFERVAVQVAHDVNSPLSNIRVQIKLYAKDIPEKLRIILLNSANRAINITGGLINRFKPNYVEGSDKEISQPVMIALALSQSLGEKEGQFKSISFTSDFSSDSTFVVVNVEQSSFMRMISNLLNNAVEACASKNGAVCLGLRVDNNSVVISIQDNGKGMPKEVINKILSDEAVATDKKEGHGIGLTQIRDTLKRNHGELKIDSEIGKGTKMILTFPRAAMPEWIAKEIKINKGDTVIVLDDEPSAHGTWDACFRNLLNDIQLKHFTNGDDAINFINSFPEKNKLFMLTDYELLEQVLNGIEVIKKVNVERAILVTSHYAEEEVQKLVIENGIKLLPKQLAAEIPIEICKVSNDKKRDKSKAAKSKSEEADAHVVDDVRDMANTIGSVFESRGKKADIYYNPDDLLKGVSKCRKDVIICVDHEFEGSKLNGFDVAKQLHEQGFTRLYLLSGRTFEKSEIPDYLTVIMKTDTDAIFKLAES